MKHVRNISISHPVLASDDGSSFWSHLLFGLGEFLQGFSDVWRVVSYTLESKAE
jgi:hypothetical protein